MDETMADEDTRDDVNILIFDYILCMTIHTTMNATKSNLSEWDMTWLEDTIQIPPIQELPVTLRIKAQVLEIIRMFNTTVQVGPTTLTEMASTFLTTCKSANRETLVSNATQVAIQLCIHAAFRTHWGSTNGSPEGLVEYLASLSDSDRAGKATEYIAQILPSIGISVEACLEIVRQMVRINKSGPTPPFDTLVDIMQRLEPPILIQLERGRVEGLTRTETQQLKQRVGMN